MNTCDHYNYVKTKTYVKSLENVLVIMRFRLLRFIYGDQTLLQYDFLFCLVNFNMVAVF